MEPRPVFSETQHFRQWWIFGPLLGIIALFLYGIYRQEVMGLPFGNNPAPSWTLVFGIMILLAIWWLLWSARLEVELFHEGITFRFFPFQFKSTTISWSAIEKVSLVRYSPLRHFGGWGVRYGPRGKAYNVSGNEGLYLEMAGGRRILLGTRRTEELALALRNLNIAFEREKW